MKKLYLLVLILFLGVFSCSQEVEHIPEVSQDLETLYFPSENRFKATQTERVIIDLSDFKTYAELIAEMDQNACNGKGNILSFTEENTILKILVFKTCAVESSFACYGHVDLFDFQNDSLRSNFETNISPHLFTSKIQESLDTQINAPFFNKEDLKRILISIDYSNTRRNTSIENLKNTLRLITSTMTKVQDAYQLDIPYFIEIDKTNFTPPPPPFLKNSKPKNLGQAQALFSNEFSISRHSDSYQDEVLNPLTVPKKNPLLERVLILRSTLHYSSKSKFKVTSILSIVAREYGQTS